MESPSVTGSEMINGKNDSLTSKTSCLEEFNDDLLLKLVDGRLYCSTNPFQKGDITESSSSSDQTEEDMVLYCLTPTDCIFDPFAPGSDDLMGAPKKKKMKGSHLPLVPQLNFDIGSESEENVKTDATEDLEEESFLESVSNSLLELIISTQIREISAENLVADSDLLEDCKTPTSLTLMSGVEETCPPAPLRPISNMKIQSRSICRKLDFSSTLN